MMTISTLAETVFVLFLFHGALGVENGMEKTIVNVEIYYESLCGDSIQFVNRQLVPAYEKLQDHLKIDFVPYGKASHKRDEKTGRWNFECQHGSAECKGNRDQACALDAIAKAEKIEDRQNLSVKLVGCVMSSENPATSVTRCASTVGLSTTTKNHLADCQNSSKADDLLVEHGERTSKLDPPLSFVPTIVVNGKNRSEARSNFQGLICGLIAQDERPSGCLSA